MLLDRRCWAWGSLQFDGRGLAFGFLARQTWVALLACMAILTHEKCSDTIMPTEVRIRLNVRSPKCIQGVSTYCPIEVRLILDNTQNFWYHIRYDINHIYFWLKSNPCKGWISEIELWKCNSFAPMESSPGLTDVSLRHRMILLSMPLLTQTWMR